jgi:hypothetical protein
MGESYDLCGDSQIVVKQVFQDMQIDLNSEEKVPFDCFRQEEAESFLGFEGQRLEAVYYYIWPVPGQNGFLFALELIFDSGERLLLSGGEDSEAIRIIGSESLMETARKLQELHGQPVLQRMVANAQPLWQQAAGEILMAIRLSRHENGLYRNDALLLDFGHKALFVQISERDGLELGVWNTGLERG